MDNGPTWAVQVGAFSKCLKAGDFKPLGAKVLHSGERKLMTNLVEWDLWGNKKKTSYLDDIAYLYKLDDPYNLQTR